MTKKLWLNIPVKDLQKSVNFYTSLGFKQNTGQGNSPVSSSILIGEDNFVLMLFLDNTFESISGNKISDTEKGSEMLISFDAESKSEVDKLAQKVEKAGGKIFSAPTENQGWMYGFGFSDPDGHRWNVLHMDMSKMK